MCLLRYPAILTAFALAACSQEPAGPAAGDVDMWQQELPIRQPWLRDHLPDETLVYVRIPHVYGLLAMPKGNVLDPALRSRENIENFAKIRQGIVDNVLSVVPAEYSRPLRGLLSFLRSPVEIGARFLPAPSTLIVVNLDIDSNESLGTLFSQYGYDLAAPLDAEGIGRFEFEMPAFIQFDAASGRLIANLGPGITDEKFRETLASLQRTTPHAMRRMEDRVDAAGQGLFAWANVKEAEPAMQMTIQPEQLAMFEELGFGSTTAVGMGWGVANGKGRLSVVFDLPADGNRGLVPNVSNELAALSVGDPDGLILFTLPDAAEFTRLESLFLQAMEPEDAAGWLELKAFVSEFIGFSIEELLAAMGPDTMYIFDRAGDYAAIRLRDADLFDAIIERAGTAFDTAVDSRDIGGKTYYHLDLPNEIALMDDAEVDEEYGWLAEIAARQRNHYYWIREGDYLYFASVPQVLMDRTSLGPSTDVGEWLRETQRIDAGSAIFSVSGSSRKVPARLYALYLQLTQVLADVAQADIDPWAMPTAAQLDLPELGTLGFTVNLGDPILSAELTFESNPAEAFGGMGTVAVVGILAAIAIPAYQDYVVRAEVSQGLNMAAPVKAGIAEYFAANGRFPDETDADMFTVIPEESESVRSITVEPDSGVIVIDFHSAVGVAGGQIWLEPEAIGNETVTWYCEGTFDDKHLPSSCR